MDCFGTNLLRLIKILDNATSFGISDNPKRIVFHNGIKGKALIGKSKAFAGNT